MPKKFIIVAALIVVASLARTFADAGETRRARRPKFSPETVAVFAVDVLGTLEALTQAARSPTPATATKPVVEAAETTWSEVVSSTTLESRVKRSLAQLRRLSTSRVAFRSGGAVAVAHELEWLATLFRVIAGFDEDVRWKEEAGGLASRARSLAQACRAGGDAAHAKAARFIDDLDDLVRGGKISDLDDVDSSGAESPTNFASLMRVLKGDLEEELELAAAGGPQFRARGTSAQEAGEITALLARLIQSSDYEFGGESGYSEYAQDLEAQALKASSAAADDDHATFSQSVIAIRRTCADCHADYRG